MVKKIYFLVGLSVLLGMMMAPLILTAGPIVEGYYFPVTKGTRLVSTPPEGLRASRVWGESIKVRGECQFYKIEWVYSPVIGTPVRAPVNFLEGTKARADGSFEFGPWVVDIASENIRKDSVVYAYHNCHPLWLTRTTFYDRGQ